MDFMKGTNPEKTKLLEPELCCMTNQTDNTKTEGYRHG